MKKLAFVLACVGLMTLSGCNKASDSSDNGGPDLSLGIETKVGPAR